MDRRILPISFAPLVAIGLLATAVGQGGTERHFALQGSVPEADAVTESPGEIRLDFTEEPREGTTSIRLIDAGGTLVPTGEAAQSEDDPTVFATAVEGVLPAGAYRVSWRAMAADGHVVSEEFAFTVGAAE